MDRKGSLYNIWRPRSLLLWQWKRGSEGSSLYSQPAHSQTCSWLQSHQWQANLCDYRLNQSTSLLSRCMRQHLLRLMMLWMNSTTSCKTRWTLHPKRDAVFVIGDFNAKIGAGYCHEEEKAVIGKFGLGERNKRGDNLVDFCISNYLVVANTLFQQHPRRLYWSWLLPWGREGCYWKVWSGREKQAINTVSKPETDFLNFSSLLRRRPQMTCG